MKVLVTGAKGFIGREIVSELSENNFTVVKIINSGTKNKRDNFGVESKCYAADITDYKNLLEIASGEQGNEINAIIHTAGLAHQFGETKKESFDAVNVEGTRNIVNLAVELQAKHFILISSTAVYGIEKTFGKNSSGQVSDSAFDENSNVNPQTLYAKSKLEAESVSREICEKNNLPLTIFRLSPVIGEGSAGNAARLITTINKGRFVWLGKGENYKSLIYKTDVARACVKVLKNKRGGTEIFNLAAKPIKMRDFVDEIAVGLNKKIYGFSVPLKLPEVFFGLNRKFFGIKKIDKIEDTIEKWLSADIYKADKIARTYDFTPETSIKEAIKKQCEWYKKVKSEK
ncbi:MAG: NAD-dependent epimerase/dehydratase family protein [Pyrinomonadaceae bacterium]